MLKWKLAEMCLKLLLLLLLLFKGFSLCFVFLENFWLCSVVLFFFWLLLFSMKEESRIFMQTFLKFYYSKSTYLLINLITNITNFSSEHIIPVYSFTRLILTHSNSSNPCHHSILGNTNNKKKSQQYNFNERLNRLLNWKIKKKKEGNIITQLQ